MRAHHSDKALSPVKGKLWLLAAVLISSQTFAGGFRDLCENVSRQPNLEMVRTVSAIIAVLDADDCDAAESALVEAQSIDLSSHSLRDLTALSFAQNLVDADLSNNLISDIASLGMLPSLQVVDLSNNKISDATPLAGMVSLQVLNMRNNLVSDPVPIGTLSNLNALYLSGNPLDSLKPLYRLQNLAWISLTPDVPPTSPAFKRLNEKLKKIWPNTTIVWE